MSELEWECDRAAIPKLDNVLFPLANSTLLILGLFVRPAAFILSGQMAYAYFFMHAAGKGNLFFPIANGGELALLYSLVFFYFVFAGAGAFSLDNRKR